MPQGAGEGADFEVYVEFSDGRRLNEVQPEAYDAADGRSACRAVWIESELGQEFKIIIKSLTQTVRAEDKKVHAQIFVDGRLSGRAIFARAQERYTCSTMDVLRDGKTVTLPLAFAKVDTVEDPSKSEINPRQASAVGAIIVKLQYGRVSAAGEKVYKPPVVSQVGKVWEGLKMRSMISGGEKANAPQSSQAKPIPCTTFHPSREGFFYEFKLHYCPMDLLRYRFGLDDSPPSASTALASRPRASQSRASSSTQVATPSLKRRRPPSLTPSSSSASSSSSSSSSSSDTDEPKSEAAMLEFFKTMMKQQEALAEKKREAKKAKKANKQAKKDQKRAEKAGRKPEQSIDLTHLSDGDDVPTAASNTSRRAKSPRRTRSVKREPSGR